MINRCLSVSYLFIFRKIGGEVGVKVRIICKSRICMLAENVIHDWDTELDACACVIVRCV